MSTLEKERSLLEKKCQGKHQHIRRLRVQYYHMEEYPDAFCNAILKRFMVDMAYMAEDAELCDEDVKVFEEMTEDEAKPMSCEYWFQDDVTGKDLDSERVRQARNQEMKTFQDMDIYTLRLMSTKIAERLL